MNNCPKCGSNKLYDKTSTSLQVCWACEWEENPDRSLCIIVAILLVTVGLIGFWIGRQTITLSDLSQQRAMDISSRVYGVCMERATDAVCKQVRDVVQKEIFAAGVELEEDVVRRAKEMARRKEWTNESKKK